MNGEIFEGKKDIMLLYVTWEPIDGQHILYVCIVLAKSNLYRQQLLQEDYDAIFTKKHATMVAYNDVV